jgi:hypothetical protein
MGFPFVGRLADRKREQAEEATKAKEGIDASLITNYCYKSYWLMYIDMPHFALQLSLSCRLDLTLPFSSLQLQFLQDVVSGKKGAVLLAENVCRRSVSSLSLSSKPSASTTRRDLHSAIVEAQTTTCTLAIAINTSLIPPFTSQSYL